MHSCHVRSLSCLSEGRPCPHACLHPDAQQPYYMCTRTFFAVHDTHALPVSMLYMTHWQSAVMTAAGPSGLKECPPATHAALPELASTIKPEKENMPSIATPPTSQYLHVVSQPQQQQQVVPGDRITPNKHHRLSPQMTAPSSWAGSGSLAVASLPTTGQQAFWVHQSPTAGSDTSRAAAVATQHSQEEAARNAAAAADAVCSQLEHLQLKPLKQLLTLCGQQVCSLRLCLNGCLSQL